LNSGEYDDELSGLKRPKKRKAKAVGAPKQVKAAAGPKRTKAAPRRAKSAAEPKQAKCSAKAGAAEALVLPPVAVLNIVSRDSDGLLLAEPLSSYLSKKSTQADKAPKNRRKSQIFEAEDERRESAIALPRVALDLSHGGRAQHGAAVPGIGAQVLAKIFPAKGEDKLVAPYQGHIIRVLSKRPAAILGIIRQISADAFRLEPINRKDPELLLAKDALNGAAAGDLALAEPLKNGRSGGIYAPRLGRVKERIDAAGGEKALSAIALYSHNIPVEFPLQVLAEAKSAAVRPLPATGAKPRGDWRAVPFITIDPETAKDHDDAVYAEADTDPANKDGHIIRVAIADVAAYVRPDSAMDIEAHKRGNSVYFPDRVVPMLPEEISNNLCSLREHEDRPAIAAEIILNARGKILRHTFHRVLIRSQAKLSYEQAQAALDGHPDDKTAPLLEPVLRPLERAYQALKQAREQRNPLELNLPERKIFLNDQGKICDIRAVPRLETHKLIEEFMIAANIAAAETLKNKNAPLLFRIHGSPPLAKLESLKEFLLSLGIKLTGGADMTPEKLNNVLAKAKGRDYEELVNQVVLRAQEQAQYSPDNIGHFGLKLRNYAHFTSPIRRYADLLLHRGLIKALKLGKDGISEQQEAELGEIAEEISAAERRAQIAERETNDRLIAEYLSDKVGAHFSGRVNGATRAGLFISLDKTGADGLAPISSLKGDDGHEYYDFDEAHLAVIGRHSRKGYQLGDAVEVRLVSAQTSAGSLQASTKRLMAASRSTLSAAKNGSRLTVPHK